MQDDMKKELHFVREELKRIKDEVKDTLINAREKLTKINTEIKDAMQERNLLSMQKQLKNRKQKDLQQVKEMPGVALSKRTMPGVDPQKL